MIAASHNIVHGALRKIIIHQAIKWDNSDPQIIVIWTLSKTWRWNGNSKLFHHDNPFENDNHFSQLSMCLNHWSLGDLGAILKMLYSILFYWLVYSDLLVIMPSNEYHSPLRMKINIGLGNALVPPGNRPLLQLMLTQIFVAIWRH